MPTNPLQTAADEARKVLAHRGTVLESPAAERNALDALLREVDERLARDELGPYMTFMCDGESIFVRVGGGIAECGDGHLKGRYVWHYPDDRESVYFPTATAALRWVREQEAK